jgi:hypothetical protein
MNAQTFRLPFLWMIVVVYFTGLASADLKSPATTDHAHPEWSRERLLDLLGSDEWPSHGELPKLMEIGTKAFPTYLQMLDDPKTDPLISLRILHTVERIPGDRSEFVPYAVRGLRDQEKWDVTISSIKFLAAAGGPSEAPLLLASMINARVEVRHAAARGLAKIGTAKEAAWLAAWLERDGAADTKEVRKAVSKAIADIKDKGSEMGTRG